MNCYEEMISSPTLTLLELYEHDNDMFMDLIMDRKNNLGLFDISKSLEENYTKSLDMITFIVSNFPKSLTEREIYLILMRASNPQDCPTILSTDVLDSMEKMLKNPRYKKEVSEYRNKIYLDTLSQKIISNCFQ